MKNLKKKGFTIVELVIVIAVIAVLAAVLIPTFVNLTKKANISADQQAVNHMNKLLAMDTNKATSADEVIEILIENGYQSDLTTYHKDYSLAWIEAENKIVLVENNEVVWPKDYEGKTFVTLKPMVKDGEELLSSLEDGKTVFVSEDITSDGLSTEAAGEYTVNLNGNKLNTTGRVNSVIDGGKLVISDGTIDATASDSTTAILATTGGYVELENVQILAASGVNPVQCYGGTMVLNNVTTVQTGNADESWYNSAIQIINTIKLYDAEKWVAYGEQAHTTVNGGSYSGKIAVQISAPGGNVTINSGNFIGTDFVIKDEFSPQNYIDGSNYESVIVINDGNFNGKIKIFPAAVLKINGGSFDCPEFTIAGKTYTGNQILVEFAKYVKSGVTVTVNGVQVTGTR